jgi:hypothetical protein
MFKDTKMPLIVQPITVHLQTVRQQHPILRKKVSSVILLREVPLLAAASEDEYDLSPANQAD